MGRQLPRREIETKCEGDNLADDIDASVWVSTVSIDRHRDSQLVPSWVLTKGDAGSQIHVRSNVLNLNSERLYNLIINTFGSGRTVWLVKMEICECM